MAVILMVLMVVEENRWRERYQVVIEYLELSRDLDRTEVSEWQKGRRAVLADRYRLALTRTRCIFLSALASHQATALRIPFLDETALCIFRPVYYISEYTTKNSPLTLTLLLIRNSPRRL